MDAVLRSAGFSLKSGHNPPPPPQSKCVFLTMVLKQALAGMEAGVEDYLCYARSAGASVRVSVFLNHACTHANRNAMCHLLGRVSC